MGIQEEYPEDMTRGGKMNEKSGVVYSIAAENEIVPGCTVSRQVREEGGMYITHFALAGGTDISAESYDYPRLLTAAAGEMTAFSADGREWLLHEQESILLNEYAPFGVRTEQGCIYTETGFRKETEMNQVLKAGKVFEMKELIPYQDGKVVNMDLINEEKMKFVLMSFDDGTGLPEHAAPGEALIFALDGKGIIGYNGEENVIKAGENFKFDAGGAHYIKAIGKFKMALLLTLQGGEEK